VFDKNGQLAPDRHRFEAAKLGFCITPLKLTGLVHEPVYLIEVVNTQLPGTEDKRVRYFCYHAGRRDFWLESPVATLLIRAPRGWRAVCPNHLDDQRDHSNPDLNWFIQPRTGGEMLKTGRTFYPDTSSTRKLPSTGRRSEPLPG